MAPHTKVSQKLPDILCGSEVLALLEAIASITHRAVVTTAYSAGPRVVEACKLQVADIDSKRMLIRVSPGLPPS